MTLSTLQTYRPRQRKAIQVLQRHGLLLSCWSNELRRHQRRHLLLSDIPLSLAQSRVFTIKHREGGS